MLDLQHGDRFTLDTPSNGRDPFAARCADLLVAVIERAEADAHGTPTGVNKERRPDVAREARDWLDWLRRRNGYGRNGA